MHLPFTVSLLAVVAISSSARADAHPPQGLRWEGGAGFGYYSMPLRNEKLSGGGAFLEIGARWHAFELATDYRWLGVTWDGDSIPSGTTHRFGLVARYNLELCCRDERGVGMITLVFDAGAALDVIEWHGGGRLVRRNGELGIALRGGPRVFALEPRLTFILAPRDPSYDMAPTCARPCDHATSPSAWDLGIMFTQSFVFGI